MREVNKDFSIPVFVDTPPGGLTSTTILEDIQTPRRITTLCQLNPEEEFKTSANGCEIYVLDGECEDHRQIHGSGHYLRIPESISISSNKGCSLFVKADQHADGDTENRVIDTTAAHHWLPGPQPEISICPLHVFANESIMLLRWENDCELKPRLDPQGEEILVINGQMSYRNKRYTPYSWLRNPTESWSKLHGAAGTLIYYKSGHFPPQSSVSGADSP